METRVQYSTHPEPGHDVIYLDPREARDLGLDPNAIAGEMPPTIGQASIEMLFCPRVQQAARMPAAQREIVDCDQRVGCLCAWTAGWHSCLLCDRTSPLWEQLERMFTTVPESATIDKDH